MSKTFAVADLHGRFDLLQKAVERIEAGHPAGGKIVFLGDYVDRGPQSREVVETLRAGPRDPVRWTWVCLKGNHEDMMVDALDRGRQEGWLANGGVQTLESYAGDIPRSHLDWMTQLPKIHWDDQRVFVHAAIDTKRPLDQQNDMTLLWTRFPAKAAGIIYPGLHIVHGHTPNRDGPELYDGRTNLDTYAVFSGRLVIGVFDDDIPGGPRSFIEITA